MTTSGRPPRTEMMRRNNVRKLFVFTILLLLIAAPAGAAGFKAQKPGKGDKCPVCGMFVAKYPDFAAQVQFRDGRTVHFDGPKDLFKYYQNIPRYSPGLKQADIAVILVTSYYTLAPIDALTAWFVTGSDVYGPMGRELVPFEKEAEARDFLKDHKGKGLLRFGGITPAVVRGLD